MNLHLSDESRRFVTEQVASGRYPSEEAVIEAALTFLRGQTSPPAVPLPSGEDPVIGSFRDDADLLDEIVAEAMRARGREAGRE